jgi:VIT1/CCC1 family predicted Fe2+/Mn2+ transporter
MPGAESHYVHRTAWLRAAVLGANDGIISAASLIMGVAAGTGGRAEILTAAVAGGAAGAMSMAAGEYVSVSSQADSEAADLAREQRALREQPFAEKRELAHIYEDRGVQPALARQVADQLMAKDALAAHARDELGLSEGPSPNRSRPPARPPSPSRLAPRCRRWRRPPPSLKPSLPPRWFSWSRSARSGLGRAARR